MGADPETGLRGWAEMDKGESFGLKGLELGVWVFCFEFELENRGVWVLGFESGKQKAFIEAVYT